MGPNQVTTLNRQHRVRPATTGQELQIVVQQRHAQSDIRSTRGRDSGSSRERCRHAGAFLSSWITGPITGEMFTKITHISSMSQRFVGTDACVLVGAVGAPWGRVFRSGNVCRSSPRDAVSDRTLLRNWDGRCPRATPVSLRSGTSTGCLNVVSRSEVACTDDRTRVHIRLPEISRPVPSPTSRPGERAGRRRSRGCRSAVYGSPVAPDQCQLSRKSHSAPRTQRIAETLPESIPQSNCVSVSLRSSSTPYCSSIRRAAARAVFQISGE